MLIEHKKIHTKVASYLWVMRLGGRGKRSHCPVFILYIYGSSFYYRKKCILHDKKPS